ncbi:MAG TPA: LLM class F420-dependent oxidoreductase [Mycobacteriales bacterium]|nr:LLM class F420-dependent oxidoreductase [Mycobacteriales bacterium]
MSQFGKPRDAAARARDLESAGIDMLWVPELYSFDAISMLGYLAAHTERVALASGILPIYSRTPTLTAMTAAGLDSVSEGRFVLGLGTSGPQVIEGWHGVPFDQPIRRTRELIDICRLVWRREVVVYDGQAYQLPLPPSQGTGLGKPLKMINHPVRDDIPIYLATLGPKNVQLTAELADGWLPAFFHPDRAMDVFGEDLRIGAEKRDPARGPLEIVAGGTVAICDEDEAVKLRDLGRPGTALYVGGMGARDRNFYNNVFRRSGYEAEAKLIQDLYLDGKKEEAAAAVPADYLKATSLVGDEGFVRERVQAYQAAGVTHLTINPVGPDPLRLIEKLKTWASS